MTLVGGYIKRDKGNFHRDDVPIQRKLEEEFDNIVKKVNQALKVKEEETKKVATQVTDLGNSTSPLASVTDITERLIYGGENRTVIRDVVATDTTLSLVGMQPGDLLKIVTIITKTVDNGITDFKINDGTNDLCTLTDIDTSVLSASSPVKAMWIEYTDYKSLTLYLAGATTFIGKIVIEILRKPQQYQQQVY